MLSSLRGHDQAKKFLSPGVTFDKVEPFRRSKPTAAIAEMLLGLCYAILWMRNVKKDVEGLDLPNDDASRIEVCV